MPLALATVVGASGCEDRERDGDSRDDDDLDPCLVIDPSAELLVEEPLIVEHSPAGGWIGYGRLRITGLGQTATLRHVVCESGAGTPVSLGYPYTVSGPPPIDCTTDVELAFMLGGLLEVWAEVEQTGLWIEYGDVLGYVGDELREASARAHVDVELHCDSWPYCTGYPW